MLRSGFESRAFAWSTGSEVSKQDRQCGKRRGDDLMVHVSKIASKL